MAVEMLAGNGSIAEFQLVVGENETVPCGDVTMENVLGLEIGQRIGQLSDEIQTDTDPRRRRKKRSRSRELTGEL